MNKVMSDILERDFLKANAYGSWYVWHGLEEASFIESSLHERQMAIPMGLLKTRELKLMVLPLHIEGKLLLDGDFRVNPAFDSPL